MKFGAVALVLVETIFGKLGAEVTHDPVPRDFRNHARSGDGQTVAVAIDDGSLRKWKWKNWEPVDQDMLGRICERTKRDSHRFMGGSQNVDPVNLEVIDHTDAPRDFGI